MDIPHQPTVDTIQTTHDDLIHDIAYDYYGKMLATCSSDQSIKIFQRDHRKQWTEIQQIRRGQSSNPTNHTHTSAIRSISWAHPLFGAILATVAMDCSINIFELTSSNPPPSDTTDHPKPNT